MDLSFYFSLFLRRMHYFVLCVVLCSAAGLFLARYLPTIYEAEARMVVESEQIPGSLAQPTVRVEAREQLQIIQQRILTRDTLIEMANRLNIYAKRRADGERPYTGEEIVRDLRERISIDITGGARRGQVQATLVSVSFTAPTGQLAAAVTNEVVTLILRENAEMRTSSARGTLEFFEQAVNQLDNDLAQQSARILAFKEENIEALPDSLEFRRRQQSTAQERLLVLERQEAELTDRRDRLVQLFEISREAGTLTTPQAQRTPEQERLKALQDQRAQMSAILSPENPRMKILDAQIAPLEEIVATQLAGLGAVDEDGRVLSAFELQLAEIDGQIGYLQEQQVDVEEEIIALTASIAATPSNATALQSLERDFDALQQQYREAVSSRAKAETGDTIEALGRGGRISIIEQAITPNEPASPNRPLVAGAGVGGGIALGLALVMLIELLKSGIRRPRDLTKGLGITAFATLPYLRTRGEILRRRLLIWGGLLFVLALSAAALWAVDTYYMPLDLLFQQIQRRLL